MNDTNIIQFIHRVNEIILNPIIRLLFLIALVLFIWGVFLYVRGADSDSERETGRKHMIWGLFGMFIMVSVFGIINVIIGTFGIDGATQGQLNQVIKR
jgi:hypothetical protein